MRQAFTRIDVHIKRMRDSMSVGSGEYHMKAHSAVKSNCISFPRRFPPRFVSRFVWTEECANLQSSKLVVFQTVPMMFDGASISMGRHRPKDFGFVCDYPGSIASCHSSKNENIFAEIFHAECAVDIPMAVMTVDAFVYVGGSHRCAKGCGQRACCAVFRRAEGIGRLNRRRNITATSHRARQQNSPS